MARILAIDTSCDETAAAVVDGRRILSNVIYSQVALHTQWGGVVPNLAKRAHIERIDGIVDQALKKYNSLFKFTSLKDLSWRNTVMEHIDAVAVTYGPGLAVALETGIIKAKALSQEFNKPLVGVNHMEGHIYSCFVQNRNGNPPRDFHFPYLALLVSGVHTELALMNGHRTYKLLGETVDDAAGEALDKAARLLGLGYPGGAPMEALAASVGNEDKYRFPRPMSKTKDIIFSFSGLKTSFLYFVTKMGEEEKNKNLAYLASSFQEAVFDSILKKTEIAIEHTGVSSLVVGGGVIANQYLRKKLRMLAKKHNGEALFPTYRHSTGDNAAMIGLVGSLMYESGDVVKEIETLERIPRLSL